MKIDDFIGQDHMKDDLYIHMLNALKRNEPLDHIAFYGPPGLGKTTFAELIASTMNVGFISEIGKEITQEKIFAILSNIQLNDILFIDEVHHTPVRIMESLYGPLQKINNLKIDRAPMELFPFGGIAIYPFTLIGATTSIGMLSKPLRDRIVLGYDFQFYTVNELEQIVVQKGCPKESARYIGSRSRGTPRIALNYFVRIRNEAGIEENITPDVCLSMFKRNGIYEEGYTYRDLEVLNYLKESGHSSAASICRCLSIDTKDYHGMYEPFLLFKKAIKITSKGRHATEKGLKVLGDYYV